MILGIAGPIGVGKNALSKKMTEYFSLSEVSIADPIKQLAINLGFEWYQVYGTQEQKLEINKHWGISGREFLQVVGTNMRYEVIKWLPKAKWNNKSIWIRGFEIVNLISKKNCIISDLRFPDEADTIHEYNGLVILIEDEKERTGTEHQHESEKLFNQLKPNIIIKNNGSLQQLYLVIDHCAEIITNDYHDLLQLKEPWCISCRDFDNEVTKVEEHKPKEEKLTKQNKLVYPEEYNQDKIEEELNNFGTLDKNYNVKENMDLAYLFHICGLTNLNMVVTSLGGDLINLKITPK